MIQDIRYGLRMLLKSPGFTLIAIFTLALGVGANTAIFSIVNAVLLRPLPYHDPDRLVMVRETKLPEVPESQIAAGTFVDWRNQNTVFEQLEGISVLDVNLTGASQPEWLNGMQVTTGFFSMMGTPPLIGRDFTADEAKPDQSNVVIISYALWQSQFGASPDVINQTIKLDDRSFTVIGVMPPNTAGLLFRNPSVWMPLAFTPEQLQKREVRSVFPLARLKQDATLEQAKLELSAIADRIANQYPATNKGWEAKIVPLLEYAVLNIRTSLWLLLGACVFVLLIACLNVANLTLARTSVRQKEIAVRSAVGASRWRIVRQLMTESLMLSIVGGSIGTAIAIWSMDVLVAVLPAWYKPRILDISIDWRILGFTIAVTALTGLVFGLVPAMHSSKPNLNEMLKDAGRGSTGGRRQQILRSALIVTEVALSLVLLTGAGLVIKSLVLLQRVETGFDPDNALTVSLSLPEKKYPDKDQQTRFYAELFDRVAGLPGVESVGASTDVPFSYARFGNLGGRFKIASRHSEPGKEPETVYFSVTKDYFRAMGITLLKGRLFTDQDTKGAPRVAVINETMARRFFQDEEPIGRRIHVDVGLNKGPDIYRQIVGIVADVKHRKDQGTDWPQIYEPFAQQPFPFLTLVVRTNGESSGLSDSIREEVLKLDKDQPIYRIATLEQLVSRSTEQQRSSAILFGLFASAALVLAAVGLYGVMSYSVSQRTREIGIRVALGAQREDVLGLIMRQGFKLTLSGIGLGLLGAWMVTRFIQTLLYGVSTTDPLTFAGVSFLLISVALFACYLPARRATKVDPMIALRYE